MLGGWATYRRAANPSQQWRAAALLLLTLCCTSSGLPRGDTVEVVYLAPRSARKAPETIEATLPRNPYHPLVRFRTIEVRPAYFYVLEKYPENDEPKLSSRELAELLSSLYEEEYNEPPPKHLKNIIRFGLIR